MQKRIGCQFDAYEGLCCKDKMGELKRSLFSQQNVFQKVTTRAYSTVKAGYVEACLIAKKTEACTDGDFTQHREGSVANIICPEKKGNVSDPS